MQAARLDAGKDCPAVREVVNRKLSQIGSILDRREGALLEGMGDGPGQGYMSASAHLMG